MLDLLQGYWQSIVFAIRLKVPASFVCRPGVRSTFARERGVWQFASLAQMMTGFMKQHENQSIVPDRRMKG